MWMLVCTLYSHCMSLCRRTCIDTWWGQTCQRNYLTVFCGLACKGLCAANEAIQWCTWLLLLWAKRWNWAIQSHASFLALWSICYQTNTRVFTLQRRRGCPNEECHKCTRTTHTCYVGTFFFNRKKELKDIVRFIGTHPLTLELALSLMIYTASI